jgi:hypothetical protein
MATTKTDAQKVTELRKQAMDKSLPQEVRDMADKKANEIEGKSVEKSTGMKLANGGAVAKPGSPRIVAKPAQNRLVAAAQKMFDAGPQGAAQKQAPTGKPLPMMAPPPKKPAPYAKGGAVKAPMKTAAKQPMKKPMMAKGGSVKKGKC